MASTSSGVSDQTQAIASGRNASPRPSELTEELSRRLYPADEVKMLADFSVSPSSYRAALPLECMQAEVSSPQLEGLEWSETPYFTGVSSTLGLGNSMQW